VNLRVWVGVGALSWLLLISSKRFLPGTLYLAVSWFAVFVMFATLLGMWKLAQGQRGRGYFLGAFFATVWVVFAGTILIPLLMVEDVVSVSAVQPLIWSTTLVNAAAAGLLAMGTLTSGIVPKWIAVLAFVWTVAALAAVTLGFVIDLHGASSYAEAAFFLALGLVLLFTPARSMRLDPSGA
jgi:hypothetical protein